MRIETGTILFMTPERVPTMEFISMVCDTKGAFIFRAPPLSYVSNIYYLPFAGIVWGCSVLLVIIGATIVYSTYVLPTCNRRYNPTAVSEVILLAVGAVCQMGTHLAPKLISGRISTVSSDWDRCKCIFRQDPLLQFTLLIGLLFIFTSYTANIVALLQSTTKTIRTLDDLLHSEMEIAVQDAPYNRYFFPLMKGSTQAALYQLKIAPSSEPARFFNLTYGVELLRKVYSCDMLSWCWEIFAFIVFTGSLRFFRWTRIRLRSHWANIFWKRKMRLNRSEISGYGQSMVCDQEALIAERNFKSQVSFTILTSKTK